MIPKFAKPGKSFKGVLLYLTHDPDHAKSSERVAWSHTINLAHDDIQGAMDEMRTTALNAELLKSEHGLRGRKTEQPVKHFSLNWHPSESPDQAEMISAAQSFLKHMGWDQHQAVVIAHTDKAYHHVHVVVNAIHPETGLKLDDGFERRRAQAWALEYEREHGKIFCEERLKPAAERQASEPRLAWLASKEHGRQAAEEELASAPFDPSYMGRDENRRLIERHEWQILKELQRDERLAFFAEGKEVYGEVSRTIYREVRKEFRNEWASYYAAKREGLDSATLAELRSNLIEWQGEVLEGRRGTALAERRAERDLEYRALLDAQKEQRGELIDRQELGMRSPELLDRVYPRAGEAEPQFEKISDGERQDEALDRFGIQRGRARDGEAPAVAAERAENPLLEQAGMQVPVPEMPIVEGRPASKDLGIGVAGGVLEALAGLAESLMGGRSQPKPKTDAALSRFGVQRGQPPPGDAVERAANDRARTHEEWREWREWHHLADGQER
jgi:hypothetical protein